MQTGLPEYVCLSSTCNVFTESTLHFNGPTKCSWDQICTYQHRLPDVQLRRTHYMEPFTDKPLNIRDDIIFSDIC